MRIWSLHPRYLDTKGLGGVWVETLLAKAVFEGKTKGYTHHPQLNRFRETSDPVKYISTYLHTVFEEATKRGFKYNFSKIGEILDDPKPLTVTKGQLEYELGHLRNKLQKRSPDRYAVVSDIPLPDTHPLFEVVEGGIESWEILEAPAQKSKSKKKKSESEPVVPTQEIRKRNKRDAAPSPEVNTSIDVQGRGKRRKINTEPVPEVKKPEKKSLRNTAAKSKVKEAPDNHGNSRTKKSEIVKKGGKKMGRDSEVKPEVKSGKGKPVNKKKPVRGKKIAE